MGSKKKRITRNSTEMPSSSKVESVNSASSRSSSPKDKFLPPADIKNPILAGLSIEEVQQTIDLIPLDELDSRLEGYANFTKQEVEDMVEKYADNFSLVFDLEHEATTMNFSQGIPLLKSYLRPDEYRALLGDLYYSLAEEEEYNDLVKEREKEKSIPMKSSPQLSTSSEHEPSSSSPHIKLKRPPFAGDELLTKAVSNSIASTLYDRVDQKHRNLEDIPSKNLFVDKDSGLPDNTMNMMLDRRRVMLDLELTFKIQLASARIDGLKAAATLLSDEETENHYTSISNPSIDEDTIPLYETLYKSS